MGTNKAPPYTSERSSLDEDSGVIMPINQTGDASRVYKVFTGTSVLPLTRRRPVGTWNYDDAEIVHAYREGHLAQETKKAVRDYLWSYAFAVLLRTLRDGSLAGRNSDLSDTVLLISDEDRRALEVDQDARIGLIIDTLILADRYFWRHSVPERWYENGGASLPTFFTNLALMAFNDAYKNWSATHTDTRATAIGHGEDCFNAVVDGELLSSHETDPATNAHVRAALGAVAKLATHEQRAILGLLLQDQTAAQISQKLSIPVRRVETQMRQLRAAVLRAVQRGQLALPDGIRPSSATARRLHKLGGIAA